MGLFTCFEISGSGLSAQRLRLDVIANNIANAETTRSGRVDAQGRPLPYRRRAVVFAENGGPFLELLRGVRVAAIVEDTTPGRLVYDPDHPDADAQGYVRMPNVNIIAEMVDLVSATRAYEANITALEAFKQMCTRALEIGRR